MLRVAEHFTGADGKIAPIRRSMTPRSSALLDLLRAVEARGQSGATVAAYASDIVGNLLSEDDQKRKLELAVETARKVWG